MSDIRTVKVSDSVIGDISPDIDFAVMNGASQNTYQKFPATSSSNSALVFVVQVPSENVIVDRAVMITSGLSLTITIDTAANGGAIPVNADVFNYGVSEAFQAFPLNSLFTTVTAQINNTTVSINQQDVLQQILKMNSVQSLTKYNSSTPALPDQVFANFYDAVKSSTSNPLSNVNTVGFDTRFSPRGAHPAKVTLVSYSFPGDGAAKTAYSLTSANQPPTWQTSVQNWSPWKSQGVIGEKWVIQIDTVVTEPLFLSPFLMGEAQFNNQGLVGINNMNIVCNIDSTCKRVFSSSRNYITSVALTSSASGNAFTLGSQIGTLPTVTAPALLFRFLSSQPSDLLQTKNVVPILDFPRYLTSSNNNSLIQPGATATLTSSNLQLNQIPDKFLICVRLPMANQSYKTTSSFLAIQGVSINLNNQSGLLSSATQQDLWRMSVRNGSHQTFQEFSGSSQTNYLPIYAQNVNYLSASLNVPTLGSLLVLNPAWDLSLPDYISSGSLGNYNLQMNITVTNQFNTAIAPEIVIVAVNSGIMVTQQGVSSIYTGILTKEMVLATKSEHDVGAMTSTEIARKIGGNMLNSPLTAVKGMVKHHHRKHGGGASGGAFSGGAASGGRLSKHY